MRAINPAWVALGTTVLAKEYLGLVGHFARILRDRILAEDLVNDAVAETLAKLHAHQIEDPERLCGFVYRVAENMLRNYRRRHCNRDDMRVAECVLDNLPGNDDLLDRHASLDLAARVRAVIEELPTARDRELVRRFYLEEEEKVSICSDLNLASIHFDRVLFRARRRMKALLSQ